MRTMHRIRKVRLVVAVVISSVMLGTATPLVALAAQPHEDPETAEPVFSGIALFRYYSASLDFALKKNPEEVQARLEKMPFANISQSLEVPTGIFVSSSVNVSQLLVEVDKNLSELRTLVAQFRLDEAVELATKTSENLSQANNELKRLEQATTTAGRELKVSSAPEGSDLRASYDEVLDRINKIRKMLSSDKEMLTNLLLGTKPTEMLKPTEVTLQIEPPVAFVGDNIRFEGKLSSQGKPLAGREVAILLDGSRYVTGKSDAGGYYQGTLQVPYQYVPELDLQALYYPQDEDIGLYVASTSPVTKLKVLFYEAELKIVVEDKAYPGLETMVAGRFDYAQSPAPNERRVEIYLDDAFITEVAAQEAFEREISLDPGIDIGKHIITVSAAYMGRYSPVVASTSINVTRATPVLDMIIPKIGTIPGSISLGGKLRSEVGPLSGASIKMGLGQSQAESVSSKDGTFDTTIKMGMGFGLIGSQDLGIEVTPREPWHAPLKTASSIVMVNVVNCSGFLALLVFLGIYLPARLKRRLAAYPGRRTRPKIAVAPTLPVPASSAKIIIPASVEDNGKTSEEPRSRILDWYRLVARLLLRITKALLLPQQTMREFANESSRVLGPNSKYFLELTRLVEKLLYSRYSPTEEDVEKSKELSQSIEEVFKSEGV